jgi:hypothetical protein
MSDKLKRYRVECIQYYCDEHGPDVSVIHVLAYDYEHAEEKAFDACGGPAGFASGMEFKATHTKEATRAK